jgi:hypothetical protein
MSEDKDIDQLIIINSSAINGLAVSQSVPK